MQAEHEERSMKRNIEMHHTLESTRERMRWMKNPLKGRECFFTYLCLLYSTNIVVFPARGIVYAYRRLFLSVL